MTTRPETPHAALVALTRFGLGPRPGDLKRIASDPRGAIEAELAKPDVALLPDPYLVSTAANARAFLERRALRKLVTGRDIKPNHSVVIEAMRSDGRLPPETSGSATKVAARAGDGMTQDMDGDMASTKTASTKASKTDARRATQDENGPPLPKPAFEDEMAARFVRVRNAEIGFVERWVLFWNNHFTVSDKNGNYLRWVAGSYDRDAIRPHVLGRFEDLLFAVSRHPAMLHYLDNQSSVGPNSDAGKKQKKGLNENHARELMELHTVGVDGGYVQADVIALAQALTGWRFIKQYQSPDVGTFRFEGRFHEPGERTVLGRVYAQDGVEQGEAILKDLVKSPKTATHLARRLAVAFVADDPPPALVERLSRTYLDTDGDLRAMARALLAADEAWAAPRTKMRDPQEFVFASARTVAQQPDPERLTTALSALGQPFWGAPSPKGYSIVGRDWIAPDAQTNRLDFAVDLAGSHAARIDPNALAEEMLGDAMSDETRTAVKRAGSREQAMALLLMSPEMQRR